MGFPGNLGTEEPSRAGNSIRKPFIEYKSSPFSYIRNQTGKAENWHGWARPDKLRCKKKIRRQWKQEQYGNTVWMSRAEIRKAKTQMELKLNRDAFSDLRQFSLLTVFFVLSLCWNIKLILSPREHSFILQKLNNSLFKSPIIQK